MKEIGLITKNMEEDLSTGQMGLLLKENGKKESLMDMESTLGLPEANTNELGLITNEMEQDATLGNLHKMIATLGNG